MRHRLLNFMAVLDWLGEFFASRTFWIPFGCICITILGHTLFEYKIKLQERVISEQTVNEYIWDIIGSPTGLLPGMVIPKHDHYTVTWPNKNSDTYCVKSFEGEHSNGPYRLHLMGKGVVIVANGRIRRAFKNTCPLEDY